MSTQPSTVIRNWPNRAALALFCSCILLCQAACLPPGQEGDENDQANNHNNENNVPNNNDVPSNNDGMSNNDGTRGTNTTSTPPREEGPEAMCPFPALDGQAIMDEEIFNQTNADNGTSPSWWHGLEFGKRGGLLRVGGVSCTPTEVEEPPTRTECFEGYDCGGCEVIIGSRGIDGEQDFYFVPNDPKSAACTDMAAFYRLVEGREDPQHACDVEFPDCACSGGSSVSLSATRFLSGEDGAECDFVELKDDHHNSCTRLFECSIGQYKCGARLTTQIDRRTGEQSWSIGADFGAEERCELEANGSVQALECPDVPVGECDSCRKNCAGIPECSCADECDPSRYQLMCPSQ